MTAEQTKRAVGVGVVAALFVISVINYLDRQSLSLLAPTIENELHFNDRTYAHIVTLFLIAYTASYVVAGRLADKIGATKSMVLFVGWWSLAQMVTPFARTARMLGIGRFLLGLGEAGNYVVAPKVIGEAFTAKNRGLAIGVYTAGATIGATLAPALVAALTVRFGWASVFFITGAVGLLWIIPWLLLARMLGRQTTIPPAAVPTSTARGSWRAVLQRKTMWNLMIMRFVTDPVWYFYLFWYPKYMMQTRGLTLTRAGHLLWVVYLLADLGTLAGGFFSGRFIAKGATPLAGRRRMMTLAACATPFGVLAALVPSLSWSLAFASLVAFAHLAWLVTLTALVVDEFPASQIGTAAGLIAAGSGLGGILSTELIGWAVATSGYLPVFIVMSGLHCLALVPLWNLREAGVRPDLHTLEAAVPA